MKFLYSSLARRTLANFHYRSTVSFQRQNKLSAVFLAEKIKSRKYFSSITTSLTDTSQLKLLKMNSPKDIETFYEAVDNSDIETVVELVTNKKVDVNHRFDNHDSKTATHIAAARRNLTLLKVLVDDLKSDLDVIDRFEQVPIENAAGHHNYAAIKYLLSRKSEHIDKVSNHVNAAEVDEFFDAVQANDVEKVRKILSSGTVEIDTPNKMDYYNTALHTACDNTNFELVKLLVNEFNADLFVENNSEEIPIHLTDDEEIVEFLESKTNE